LLDLEYSEDKDAEVDFNVVMTGSGRYVEVQGGGEEATFARTNWTAPARRGRPRDCGRDGGRSGQRWGEMAVYFVSDSAVSFQRSARGSTGFRLAKTIVSWYSFAPSFAVTLTADR